MFISFSERFIFFLSRHPFYFFFVFQKYFLPLLTSFNIFFILIKIFHVWYFLHLFHSFSTFSSFLFRFYSQGFFFICLFFLHPFLIFLDLYIFLVFLWSLLFLKIFIFLNIFQFLVYLLHLFYYLFYLFCIFFFPLGVFINRAIGLMSWVFTKYPGDRGSIPGRVIPKTQ